MKLRQSLQKVYFCQTSQRRESFHKKVQKINVMESGGESGSNAEASGGALQRVFYCHECQRRTFPNAEHIEVLRDLTCQKAGIFRSKLFNFSEFYVHELRLRIC